MKLPCPCVKLPQKIALVVDCDGLKADWRVPSVCGAREMEYCLYWNQIDRWKKNSITAAQNSAILAKMKTDVIKYSSLLVIGIIIGLGISTLFSDSPAGESGEEGQKYSNLRLKRDNESLRRHVEQLENQVAALEKASPVRSDTGETDVEASPEPIAAEYAENPAELGAFVGSLRKKWDQFQERYSERLPAPGDPDYVEFLAGYQQMVAEASVLGVQVTTMPTYQPEEFAAFHSEFAASYLDLHPLTKEKIQPVVADLVNQLNEHNLGRDSFPEDRTKMREWIQNRNNFEREATKIVAQSLPSELQQRYIETFDDDIFESGISDMLREMRRFTRSR